MTVVSSIHQSICLYSIRQVMSNTVLKANIDTTSNVPKSWDSLGTLY